MHASKQAMAWGGGKEGGESAGAGQGEFNLRLASVEAERVRLPACLSVCVEYGGMMGMELVGKGGQLLLLQQE